MPRKSLESLLTQDFDTLTMWEQYRLLSAMLRADDTYRPFHILFKRELPRVWRPVSGWPPMPGESHAGRRNRLLRV